jgi:hypothetical protein
MDTSSETESKNIPPNPLVNLVKNADASFTHRKEHPYMKFHYKNHKNIKKSLQNFISSRFAMTVLGGASRTRFNLHQENPRPDCLEEILMFLNVCMHETCVRFSAGQTGEKIDPSTHHLNFDPNKFVLAECWGIQYKQNEGVTTHNHFPYILSWTYNIHTPTGSAPLVLDQPSGSIDIPAEEGSLVIFLGSKFHKVIPQDQKGDDRCCLIGNVSYG